MAPQYISKRQKVSDLLTSALKQVDAIDKAQFELTALQHYGASANMVTSVLETYAKAGIVSVDDDTIHKRGKL